MFSAENAKRELHGHGGEQSLKLDGRAIPSTGADDSCSRSPLALPAPDSTEGDSQQEGETRVLEVGGESVKIDKLGPLIVNTDGVRPCMSSLIACSGPDVAPRSSRCGLCRRSRASPIGKS
jgi:hypothetical protein